MSENELCFLRSTELAAKLRRREVSAVEVTEAHLKQIERVNPKVNAIVTLAPEPISLHRDGWSRPKPHRHGYDRHIGRESARGGWLPRKD